MFQVPFRDLGDGAAIGEYGCDGHDQHLAHVMLGAVAWALRVFSFVLASHEASQRCRSISPVQNAVWGRHTRCREVIDGEGNITLGDAGGMTQAPCRSSAKALGAKIMPVRTQKSCKDAFSSGANRREISRQTELLSSVQITTTAPSPAAACR